MCSVCSLKLMCYSVTTIYYYNLLYRPTELLYILSALLNVCQFVNKQVIGEKKTKRILRLWFFHENRFYLSKPVLNQWIFFGFPHALTIHVLHICILKIQVHTRIIICTLNVIIQSTIKLRSSVCKPSCCREQSSGLVVLVFPINFMNEVGYC